MSEESGQPSSDSVAPIEDNTSGEISQENSAENEIAAAAEAGEISQAEAQKLIKKYQLKVKGQTIEKEIDLSDDDFIKNQLQLAEMSKMSMQESAELKKAYARELERWKQDPWAIMQELGLDPDDLSERRIQSRIDEMKKTPEQLASEKYQRDLEEAHKRVKQLEEEKQLAERSQLEQQALVGLESEIDQALSGHKTLPNSKEVRKNIADAMLWAINNGFPDATASDVVPLVEKEMMERLNSLYDDLPDEALDKFISKKTQDRMRKKRLGNAPAAVPSVNAVKPTTQSIKGNSPVSKAPEKIRAKDFFRK